MISNYHEPHSIVINNIKVYGIDLDFQTRCKHYHEKRDIIAIQMKCCNKFYACSLCHDEIENHEIKPWNKNEFHIKAVLCGNCGELITIDEYINCKFICPNCGGLFNPNCKKHYNLYFDI